MASSDASSRIGASVRASILNEFGGKTHDAQHAHRVLAVARLGIADHAQYAGAQVGDAADVVHYREIADVVIKPVDREIAAARVLFLGAEDILVGNGGRVLLLRRGFLAVGIVIGGIAGCFLQHAVGDGAEGRHLDDLASKAHMHQAETPADDARVVAQLADFLGARVGDDVEVLGLAPEHEIAHAAADEEAGVAGIAQAMQDLEGVFTDQRAGNGMLRAREDGGLANLGFTLSAVAAGSPVVKIAFARIIPLLSAAVRGSAPFV